jgi:CIC family chloride channel protein
LEHPGELVAYAALGVIGGFASLVFVKLVAYLRPKFRQLPKATQYFQPAIAGLLIGLIGIRYPQVMGAGYDYIDQAMHGRFPWELLAVLAGLKLLATTLSFVSGTPGGLFAPTLFMGAMIGGAVGSIEQHFFPNLAISAGAYALVGMGTLFAGIMRAPMTSVFMMLEVTGNYSIIVPVIISNAIAYFISRTFQPTPIFDMLSRQDGLDLPSLEEERELAILRVEDAMQAPGTRALMSDESLATAQALANSSRDDFFLVSLTDGHWQGISRDALMNIAGDPGSSIVKFINMNLPVLHPDHSLDHALRVMEEWPMVPVVHRADFRRLVGVVAIQDILKVYRSSQVREEDV